MTDPIASGQPAADRSAVGASADGPTVEVERRDDGVAIVTFANGKMNALCIALLEGLRDAARALAADPPGAVVLTGGPKIFAAGADISEFGGPDEAREIGRRFVEATTALEAIPRPVLASISGYALGGGCEIALACDLRFASDRARLGQPEVLLGIIPGGGGTQRLTRLVGPAIAKDLCWTGRQVRADEALAMGLVDRVVPGDELDETVLAYAVALAGGASQAHGAIKAAVNGGTDLVLADGLELEQALFAEVFTTDDAGIGVRSFLEHGPGKAAFSGR